MALGIAHDYGCVWDAKWCPKGCYIESKNESEVDRLGVLAVSFGDGYIRLYSVPVPEKLAKVLGLFEVMED